jgi:exopolysaccharide biosynthesis polyprenyl glycosylphosphotransferase
MTPVTSALAPTAAADHHAERGTLSRTGRSSARSLGRPGAGIGLGAYDAVSSLAAGFLLVGKDLRVVAIMLGWMLLLRALTAPTAKLLRPSVTPVWRAATLVVLGCWIAGSALPISHRHAMAGVALVAFGSGMARLAARGRRLRVLLVGCTDRAVSALGLTSVGKVRPIDVCGPTPAELARRLAAHRRDAFDAVLVVPGPEVTGRALQRLAWEAEAVGLPLLVETGIDGVIPSRVAPLVAGDLGLVHLRPAPRRGWRALVKQLLERSLALAAIVALAPVWITIAIAVKLDSAGPVLFRQERVGRDGRTFTMLKFRSMSVDAEHPQTQYGNDGAGPLFKLRQDPRITRVGGFLRRYSLDELPQLINVVRGDMALVGPRPALPSEVEAYDHDPRRRLAVAPGITGLWQVSGRSDLSWSETVRLDLDYVDNWSLGRDLVIMARTFGAVLRHDGAY